MKNNKRQSNPVYSMNDNKPPKAEYALMENQTDERIIQKVEDEQMIESFKKVFDQLMNNETVEPFIMAKNKDRLLFQKLEHDADGNLIMPAFKPPSKWELIKKKRKVNRIMKFLNPILKRDIEDVVRLALMRKNSDRLERLETKLKQKKSRQRVRVVNRVGCIFVEDDEDSYQL